MFKILGLIIIVIIITDLVINGGGIWKALIDGVKSLFNKAKDKLDN